MILSLGMENYFPDYVFLQDLWARMGAGVEDIWWIVMESGQHIF